jgi:hypothetical protein
VYAFRPKLKKANVAKIIVTAMTTRMVSSGHLKSPWFMESLVDGLFSERVEMNQA